MNFAARSESLGSWMVENRRFLHQHAELSLKEKETTDYIVSVLTELGIPVQTFPDYPGCIATIKGGKAGADSKTVMLRADIDALPIKEASGEEFTSLTEGVMHACGHDCHASALLGAARLLQEQKEELAGTVKLLFQSGEEIFYGSHYYWDKGYLNDVDAAFGMHVWPTVESGKFGIPDGAMMASCDNFKITVHGVSAHGSTPHMAKDAIVAASSIILNLQTIVSRINDPNNSLVVSVDTIRSGTQFNIIADTAEMTGTVRCYTKAARELVEPNMRRILDDTAAALGCTAELEYNYLEPCVRNDDLALNEIARKAAASLYEDCVIEEMEPASGSEDFSYLMEKIPNSMFVFLGTYNKEKGCVYPLHNGKFKPDEDAIHKGAALYAQFAYDYLDAAGKED